MTFNGAPSLSAHDVSVLIDFLLFAATLAGVAIFHRHTLAAALIGLVVIVIKKLLGTGFVEGAGFPGLFAHFAHEWVLITNLFLLLIGFALLARHFEASRVPDWMPAALPDGWTGGFVLLVLVFVLSSFLDNIAAALIGATVARHVFKGRRPRRLPRGDCRCVQRRRRGQRYRRHDDDHALDRRSEPVCGVACLYRRRLRAARLGHSRRARPTEICTDRQSAAFGRQHLVQIRCRGYRRARGGDRRKCRSPSPRPQDSGRDSAHRTCGGCGDSPDRPDRSAGLVRHSPRRARRDLPHRARLGSFADAGRILADAELGNGAWAWVSSRPYSTIFR